MSASMIQRLRQPGAIRIEFQPIVRVHEGRHELYAVEALTRGPRGTSMERPDVLFDYARRKGQESAIDLISIATAFAEAPSLTCAPLLSINIHGTTLTSIDRFTEWLLTSAASHGIAADRLMLEIIEHRAPWVIETFRATLDELRDAGVRIAVDDLGVGASNYQMIVDCRPDHLKVDRHIVFGCSRDPWRRAVLESIVTLARSCDATPVAEGIEDVDDLAVLLGLGINTVQGWLYAPSMPAPELAASPMFQAMKGRNP